MRPGDLMFFYNSGGVYHVAIFVGLENGHAMMVHAPGSGQRVTVAAPWTGSLVRRHAALTPHRRRGRTHPPGVQPAPCDRDHIGRAFRVAFGAERHWASNLPRLTNPCDRSTPCTPVCD